MTKEEIEVIYETEIMECDVEEKQAKLDYEHKLATIKNKREACWILKTARLHWNGCNDIDFFVV